MGFDPLVCTPTMSEDELLAHKQGVSFVDPDLESRLTAVKDLQTALKTFDAQKGWTGASATTAGELVAHLIENAANIQTALESMKQSLVDAASDLQSKASAAYGRLPSATASGWLADTGRNLSDLTDGWGILDTGEAVARAEEQLAVEREMAAADELKTIRASLAASAEVAYGNPIEQVTMDGDPNYDLPVVDVGHIDANIPPVGSNSPVLNPPTGPGDFPTTDPGVTPPGVSTDPEPQPWIWTPPDFETGGHCPVPTVDDPGVGTVPGGTTGPATPGPGTTGLWGGSGTGISPAGVGVGGAAALLGARAVGGTPGGGSSFTRTGGSGATYGRGLLSSTNAPGANNNRGAMGTTPRGGAVGTSPRGGAAGTSSGRGGALGTSARGGAAGTSARGGAAGTSARGGALGTSARGGAAATSARGGAAGTSARAGAAGTSARGGASAGTGASKGAAGRSTGALGGRGQGRDDKKKQGRTTLGGPLGPDLEIDDDEFIPLTEGGRAGSRD